MEKESKANKEKGVVKKTEATKTTTKKATTAKKTASKVATKKVPTKLNETVNIEKDINKIEEKIASENMNQCAHCHKYFEKGLTICPHCRKTQKQSIGLTFFIVFGIVFLFAIICFHFADKYILNNQNEADYKASCELVSYENIVRQPKDYKDKDIKIIGKVVEVNGYDDGFGNSMTITINANIFENDTLQYITVDFVDKDYSQGLINGDLITIYGKYISINGNIPHIDAEYIVFGQ